MASKKKTVLSRHQLATDHIAPFDVVVEGAIHFGIQRRHLLEVKPRRVCFPPTFVVFTILPDFSGFSTLVDLRTPFFSIMKTAAVLAALFGSVAAFAPAQKSTQSTTALSATFDKELGVQPPLFFWYVRTMFFKYVKRLELM